MTRLKSLAFLLTCAATAGPAWADGLASLDNFLRQTKSLHTEFTQVVHAPPRDGQPARARSSSGVFEFQRPNRFRFVYKKPFAQTIVADGQTLWLYDIDLQQVSARKQSEALGSTPAGLIAGSADMRQLQSEFDLRNAPDQDGLQWVVATPKAREGQVQSVRIGLLAQAGATQLRTLEILDALGQRSVLSFDKQEVNPRLAADAFAFVPPAGVPVLRP